MWSATFCVYFINEFKLRFISQYKTRAFSLPPLYKCDLHYSGILRIVDWWFVIDISIQPICPISRIRQSKKNAENICVLPVFYLQYLAP
jgi:hypothetical protein